MSKSKEDIEEVIRKIEAMDSSVLPDKEEILKKLRTQSEKPEKSEKKDSVGNNNILLSIGLFFQFIFTVSGGGMLIAGIIAGFNVHWDRTLANGIADISIVLVVVGAILFAVGIGIGVALYKSVQKKFKSRKK